MDGWWREYVGIPFKEKGRDLAGFDCWGLVCHVYHHKRGIILPDYLQHYEKTDDREALGILIAEQSKTVWKQVEGKPAPFDVIIGRMRGVPMHVMLVTKAGYMLHCVRGIGTVLERYDTVKWRSSIEGIVRYDGESKSICSPAAIQQ